MKLPSLQQVVRESSAALRRFPLVLIAAFVWTVTVLILVDYEGPPSSSILFKVLYAASLGFPLLLAVNLVAERRRWPASRTWGVQGICAVLLVGYALTVPSYMPAAPEFHTERLLLLFLSMCLLGVVAPYVGVRQLHGFWHFCKLLIQRILLSGVFSVTLYGGLALALAAVDQLFGIDVPGKRYAELGLLILGLFATWFFLAGVPRDLDTLESRTDYPRVLKVFGQYILAPLLLVYFVILYAYIAKIIVEWNWPKGMVGGLIFGFAASGIVAYLLLYPIRKISENRWIERAIRWFWIVMVPVTVVLELAVWRRVSEYGITEHRYLALILGVWLAAMAVYFLVSRTKSIKAIPGSICVVALLVSFGPWGAFSVSESSQVNRLEHLLTKNELLIDGTVQPAQTEIDAEDVIQISSIIRYLRNTYGYAEIQPWFTQSLSYDSTGVGSIDETPSDVVAMLGLEYTLSPRGTFTTFYHLLADTRESLPINDYDRLSVVQHLRDDMPKSEYPESGIVYGIDSNLAVLTLRLVHDGVSIDTTQFLLRPNVDSLLSACGDRIEDTIPVARLSIEKATDQARWKVVLLEINARKDANGIEPTSYDALILYSRLRD